MVLGMPVNVIRLESRLLFDEVDTYGAYACQTWHFSYNDTVANAVDTADDARDAIQIFFATTNGSGSVGDFLSSHLTGAIEYRWWDLNDYDPGPPVVYPEATQLANGSIAGGVGSSSLPTQVATCLTEQCNPYGGHRRQSFYNRQYIGPLSGAAITTGGRVIADWRTLMLEAYGNVNDHLDGLGPDREHVCVYSPKHNSSGLVIDAWVDDVFDIQRRRALAPHTKTHVI